MIVMKILLLSRYDRMGASSRLRSFQYIPHLESRGWDIDVRPLFSNSYLAALYSGRSLGLMVLKSYLQRILVLLKVRRYDLIWIEKELFPFMPAFAERLLNKLGVHYVVDYDDALFHRYDTHRSAFVRMVLGGKIDVVMNKSTQVIVGNKYLANRAQLAGAKEIEIIPTVIDLDHYIAESKRYSPKLTIGWIGSPSTTGYLLTLLPVFSALKKIFNVRILAVGANKKALEDTCIDVLPWLEESEVSSLYQFDIGIMPLNRSPWERGKCGYKLIQYMACGLPVVATSIGVNKDIVEQGVNGFLAQNLADWELYLSILLKDNELRYQMGVNGKKKVKKEYSLQSQISRLNELLHGII